MVKKLHTTVDYYDDVLSAKRFFEPEDFRAMMRQLREAGVTQVDWVLDVIWRLYEVPCGGYPTALEAAADAAKAEGLKFVGVLKPFERCIRLNMLTYPKFFPEPPEGSALETIGGWNACVDPFVVRNPEFQMERIVEKPDAGLPIQKIELIKSDTAGHRLDLSKIELWSGVENGELSRWDGELRIEEKVARKQLFPSWQDCRVLEITGFSLPPEHRFVLLRYPPVGENPSWGNLLGSMMELYDSSGESLPVTPAENQIGWSDLEARADPFHSQLTRYQDDPAVRDFMGKPETRSNFPPNFFGFDTWNMQPSAAFVHFDDWGYAGVYRGKSRRFAGLLHPGYPEVQEHWLGLLDWMMKAGADGIDIRFSHHGKSSEWSMYGFNFHQDGGECPYDFHDWDLVAEENGAHLTKFLHRARELSRGKGKTMALHIETAFFERDDRSGRMYVRYPTVPNLRFEWEKWLEEDLADSVKLKGCHLKVMPAAESFVDRISRRAKELGKEVVYLSGNKEVEYRGGYERVRQEIETVLRHPRIDAFNLYEVNSYREVQPDGTLDIVPQMRELLESVRDRFGD